MLSIIYWDDHVPTRYQLGMNTATLLGSMIGQVVFGLLADRYGRRKMYGLELIVTITASMGLATASTGIHGSMSLIGLLIFWRLVMGVGIGADYPLSAVITAESVSRPISILSRLTTLGLLQRNTGLACWHQYSCANHWAS